jgi:hypothetical protein
MAGFFGLFAGKPKYIEEVTESDRQLSKEKRGAFFLDSDDAKSFGNAEYMRKPITIKRTFPKTLAGEGAKIIRQISSTEITKLNDLGIAPANSASTSSTTNGNQAPVTKRSADSSMDAFLKMAREMKK